MFCKVYIGTLKLMYNEEIQFTFASVGNAEKTNYIHHLCI